MLKVRFAPSPTGFLHVGGAVISTHLAGKADVFSTYLPLKVIAEHLAIGLLVIILTYFLGKGIGLVFT